MVDEADTAVGIKRRTSILATVSSHQITKYQMPSRSEQLPLVIDDDILFAAVDRQRYSVLVPVDLRCRLSHRRAGQLLRTSSRRRHVISHVIHVDEPRR